MAQINTEAEQLARRVAQECKSLRELGDSNAANLTGHEGASNPHGLDKAAVGLDQVENLTPAAMPVSSPQAAALSLRVLIADIQDVLTSSDPVKPLSANQGKTLKDLIDGLTTSLSDINTLLASDDPTLDELQEVVDYIKLNRSDLDTLSIPSISGLQAALDAKQATIDQDLNTGDSPTFAGLATGGVIHAPAIVAKVDNAVGNTQPILNNTWVMLEGVFDNVVADPQGVVSNGKITPNVAGYYDVKGIWVFGATGLGSTTQITALYKNGSLYSLLGRGQHPGDGISGFGGSDIVYMNGTTDYLQLAAYQGSGATQGTYGAAGYNRFSIHRVGD